MTRTIQPAQRVSGTIRLPGDKSVSHRYAMLAALAAGRTEITNYSTGADCASTLDCLERLGVEIERSGGTVCISGSGLDGLRPASQALEAGNSGSTIRMLSGILAGQPFETTLGGDESLSRRPMRRIIAPLSEMGAVIQAREGDFPPLLIKGSRLKPIDYPLSVASAQVKTAVLFAGLFADGITSVTEPLPTRNHSEIALREFGATIEVEGRQVRVTGRPRLEARNLQVPSDLSSAAFFLVAGLLLPGSELIMQGVGLNPTRAVLLEVLRRMGANVEALSESRQAGEAVGDLRVRGPADGSHPALAGGRIHGATTAGVIDEIPVLAVLGAASDNGLEIRDAAELRVKETDRIATVAENLGRMGIAVEVFEDGMRIPGRQIFRAAELDSFGDHRIAMAFSIAALLADGPCALRRAEAASISFPEFYQLLSEIAA